MKLFKNEEEAVSPVIGVILMVAIVVILAAVIAAFVFGMAGSTSSTKAVAVTAQQQGADDIILTYQGGKDHSAVDTLDYTITDSAGNTIKSTDSGAVTFATSTTTPTPLSVGDTITVNNGVGDFTGKDHIVVVATFLDGQSQVILDTFI